MLRPHRAFGRHKHGDYAMNFVLAKRAISPAAAPAAGRRPQAPIPLTLSLPFAGGQKPLRATRLAHASALIQSGAECLLTDPWFSEKPLYHPGERFAMRVDELPPLAGVLTSMNHYDHFDVRAFSGYRDRDVPFIVIAGSRQPDMASCAGFRRIRALKSGESTDAGAFRIHAIAANPDVAPHDFVYEQAYVIEIDGRHVLFAPHFLKEAPLREVARRFPRIDLALLGVNGLRVKPLGWRQLSMDPADAARLCAALKVKVAVPIHYAFNGGWVSSTFLLQHRGTPEQFSEAARVEAPETIVVTLPPGQPLDITA
jgi:L-ascorbate metabolism protein UlaG (beta-lactamase superfamily)